MGLRSGKPGCPLFGTVARATAGGCVVVGSGWSKEGDTAWAPHLPNPAVTAEPADESEALLGGDTDTQRGKPLLELRS